MPDSKRSIPKEENFAAFRSWLGKEGKSPHTRLNNEEENALRRELDEYLSAKGEMAGIIKQFSGDTPAQGPEKQLNNFEARLSGLASMLVVRLLKEGTLNSGMTIDELLNFFKQTRKPKTGDLKHQKVYTDKTVALIEGLLKEKLLDSKITVKELLVFLQDYTHDPKSKPGG